MRKQELWVTYDDAVHNSPEAALKHLDEMRGRVITEIAKILASLDFKYSSMVQWLDDNLDMHAKELVKIHDDSLITEEV